MERVCEINSGFYIINKLLNNPPNEIPLMSPAFLQANVGSIGVWDLVVLRLRRRIHQLCYLNVNLFLI